MSFVLVLPAAILLPALVLPHAAVPKVEAHAASRASCTTGWRAARQPEA